VRNEGVKWVAGGWQKGTKGAKGWGREEGGKLVMQTLCKTKQNGRASESAGGGGGGGGGVFLGPAPKKN
jgi:hypothetical protein